MESLDAPAGVVVLLAAIWLIGLAAVSLVKPERAKDFLRRFADSASTHFLEVFVRLIVGVAFVVYSSHMKFSVVVTGFGWMLILTTVVLFFVPWKLHRRFAERSLPLVTGRMVLFGIVSFLGGFAILFSFFLGPDTPQ